MSLLRWAPKDTFSSVVGLASRQKLPRPVRSAIYRGFARRVGANLDEAELPLDEYSSFDAFFTRRLKPGLRPIDAPEDVVVSPCDGTVAEHGTADAGRLIQAKGHDYKLGALLCDADAARRFEGGAYLTIYLAPRDYHRVHVPLDGAITGFQHVPGAAFPVNVAAVRHIGGLFTKNERLITYLDTAVGEIAVVMVAATGVGHMTVSYDAVATHARGRGRPGSRVRFSAPIPVKRGDELGAFHLGSTVILCFEPGRVALDQLVRGHSIRLGDPIAHPAAATAQGDAAA